jgi:AcrR family transcriptional regulator
LAKERKNQIIRAAAKRFARHGLSKTTLNEIARDVRIGKATIYHYFESKDQLFFETLSFETSQYITDIKAIFNNEETAIGARLLEYFSYKENVDLKFRLLFEMMLLLFGDESFDREKTILTKFLKEEEEIVKLILSSVYSGRIESMNTSLPGYIVMSSWGLLFGMKLKKITDPDKVLSIREILFRNLEHLLS